MLFGTTFSKVVYGVSWEDERWSFPVEFSERSEDASEEPARGCDAWWYPAVKPEVVMICVCNLHPEVLVMGLQFADGVMVELPFVGAN